MTNKKELLLLKTKHRVVNSISDTHIKIKEFRIDFEECKNIDELTEIHVYQRIAQRSEYQICNDEQYSVNVDNILTTIIISDFDMRDEETEYIETFKDSVNCECFDLDYDTLTCTLIQLS